ncbi:MAG: glucose-6-phosphate isomerase [Planctomycetota bacterium]|jgi:glucose-6-phosphate isomerase
MSDDTPISLDVSRVFAGAVGEHGLDEKELDALAPAAASAHEAVQAARGTGMLGWTELPKSTEAVERSREVWAKVGESIEDLVVFGIGGSALGTTCVATALLHPLHNLLSRDARRGRPRIWVLDNIDPDWIAAHLDLIDPAKTVFSVVSKSGTTAETMSQFLVARKMLEDRLGDDYRRHIVCTTDPEGGKLRGIAADEGFETLPVPQGVGGRFSVLSPVGIFPAVATGVDVEGLLAGAAAMDERCGDADMWKNPALMQAAILHTLGKMGVNIHVMMPYSQALRDYADWYKQLLAESLGKKTARDGSVVHAGPTPAKALGVTDQHSQIQLYTEGPFDKLITIIQVEKFAEALPLPSVYEGIEGVSYLGGHTLAELMAAECAGTQVALEQGGRPFEVVTIPEVNAHVLGELFMWAELAIAYGGELLGIDAFDQPGVEAGKRAAYALMGRSGFEELRAQLEKRAAAPEKHVL